jgi:pyridoxamine 5'-phosphate oxidase
MNFSSGMFSKMMNFVFTKYVMSQEDVSKIRVEYSLHSLDEKEVLIDPFSQFEIWWKEVLSASVDEPNAMTLATSDKEGRVDARTVLLKGYNGDGFVFFTNYESLKGRHLQENANCCLLFFWKELERQVRITGVAEKVSDDESREYFLSRPAGSRIGAWASPQSKAVENKDWLEKSYLQYENKFQKEEIFCPPHWGGYRVKPLKIEFWQGRPSRMHDRILYTIQPDGNWKIERLAP